MRMINGVVVLIHVDVVLVDGVLVLINDDIVLINGYVISSQIDRWFDDLLDVDVVLTDDVVVLINTDIVLINGYVISVYDDALSINGDVILFIYDMILLFFNDDDNLSICTFLK